MNFLWYFVFVGASFAATIEHRITNAVSEGLLECYNDTFIVINDNQLPRNIHALIAMIRKVEDNPLVQMDLRQLSVAILHRFRQDGIKKHSGVITNPGVSPYAASTAETAKFRKIFDMIPKGDNDFQNESLSLIERCSFHFMLSMSLLMTERGDEGKTCQTPKSDEYRAARNVRDIEDSFVDHHSHPKEIDTSVKIINKNDDPNLFYPPLPPNHPANGQLRTEKDSQCPLVNGVINTEWGDIAGGVVLAGIAAGVQPQSVKVGDLIRKDWQEEVSRLSNETVSNRWMTTLGIDLAELALLQGPKKDKYTIGIEGHWNSSVSPKYYFLKSNEDLEVLTSEVRGDLDGLILASALDYWYKKIPNLRLSQLLDMYYISDRGVFNASMRACNRRALLTTVAPRDELFTQGWRVVEVLYRDISYSTLTDKVREQFASQATDDLLNFIPSQMNEKACSDVKVFYPLGADLIIFVDTNWPWHSIKNSLTVLLENSEINKFSSNFTLINAANGFIMINSSNSILDFYSFNETQYSSHARGFDLPKVIGIIQSIENRKLDQARDLHIGGARSSIALIVPYSSTSISDEDRKYSIERLPKIYEQVPDATILFWTLGSKDRWSDFTLHPTTDVISVLAGSTAKPINLLNRMKQVPRRLLNSECGSNWSAGTGNAASYSNYLEPGGKHFYRLHPNYFFTAEGESAVKIQGSSGAQFIICSSRSPIDGNATENQSDCPTISSSETHRIPISCVDASLINECQPLYVSIFAKTVSNDSIVQCPEPERCRYPHMMKYTISYENLRCTSAAGIFILSPILSFTVLYFFLIEF